MENKVELPQQSFADLYRQVKRANMRFGITFLCFSVIILISVLNTSLKIWRDNGILIGALMITLLILLWSIGLKGKAESPLHKYIGERFKAELGVVEEQSAKGQCISLPQQEFLSLYMRLGKAKLLLGIVLMCYGVGVFLFASKIIEEDVAPVIGAVLIPLLVLTIYLRERALRAVCKWVERTEDIVSGEAK